MKTTHKILLCLVTAAGGCATANDTPPAPNEGNVPTIAAIKGDQIPSELVEPDRYYATSRLIDSIDLTELTPEALAVAARIDGLSNGRPDHAIDADELIELEGSPRWRTLSPDEQAAVPLLWRFLQVTPDIDGSGTH